MYVYPFVHDPFMLYMFEIMYDELGLVHGSISISVVTVWYHSRYHSSSAYRQSMHSPGLVDEKSFKKRKDSQAKKKKEE